MFGSVFIAVRNMTEEPGKRWRHAIHYITVEYNNIHKKQCFFNHFNPLHTYPPVNPLLVAERHHVNRTQKRK